MQTEERIYNLIEQKVVSTKKYTTYNLNLQLNNFLSLPYTEYVEAIRSQLAAQFEQWKLSKDLVLFNIELNSNDELDLDDVDHIYVLCYAFIASKLCDNAKLRNEEYRLRVKTDDINVDYAHLLKLVNYSQVDGLNVKVKYNSIVISMV